MAKRANSGGRGVTGRTGVRGERGATGARGPAGPAGAVLSRRDVLAMVEDQFAEMRKELTLQLARMGQIQAQLDQIHTMIKKLAQSSS